MAQVKRSSGDVAKYAIFTIIWAIVALAAFAALPWVVNNGNTSDQVTGGQIALSVFSSDFKVLNAQHSLPSATYAVIFLVPLMGLIILVLGIMARIRVPSPRANGFQIFLGAVGILSTLFWFVPNVLINKGDQNKFIQAAIIVAIAGLITRLRKPIMNFFSNNPTIASVLTVGLLYLTFWLGNQATLFSIVLTQAGLWLTLTAFGLTMYGGYRLGRTSRKARKA